ncbi:hypothetical protein A2318_00080 [Candidatus Uhrbacteria bacterium RIFOXYB2_FULL_45_11]|uniref:Cytochrome oxidase subunit II transmembrane region profile domain-containing protein n=1 Tax=Candidatus Uhrbacteria bacterium RIFOXYB2_FULL_45_11 TaxID=1802421 RepID=A0A1F7W9C3_9BACT|nr:MAG: hypothetical protein A2318_00080 [Candidatus Uhrbacteria bacterium RIFOXYB2_FULL_45_11]
MKKFRTFIYAFLLTFILFPSRVFADGGYSEGGSDAFLEFILWTIIVIIAILGLYSSVIFIIFLLNKLGNIHLPPKPPAS